MLDICVAHVSLAPNTTRFCPQIAAEGDILERGLNDTKITIACLHTSFREADAVNDIQEGMERWATYIPNSPFPDLGV